MCCLVFFLVSLYVASAVPTTPNFKDIYVGRCLDIQQLEPTIKTNSTCEELFDFFADAYRAKQYPVLADFDAYLAAASHEIPLNKALFWTGTSSVSYGANNTGKAHDIVHDFSDSRERYWTLEDTLWGGIVNGMTWCGKDRDAPIPAGEDPFDYEGNCGSTIEFWFAASEQMAKSARGSVKFLAMATTDADVYRTDAIGNVDPAKGIYPSIFAVHELPNINVDVVTDFSVLLLLNEGRPKERCGSGSLNNLREAVMDKFGARFTYKCTNNPDDVLHLYCVGLSQYTEGSAAAQCQFLLPYISSFGDQGASWSDMAVISGGASVASFMIGLVFALLLIKFCRRPLATPLSEHLV